MAVGERGEDTMSNDKTTDVDGGVLTEPDILSYFTPDVNHKDEYIDGLTASLVDKGIVSSPDNVTVEREIALEYILVGFDLAKDHVQYPRERERLEAARDKLNIVLQNTDSTGDD